MILLESSLPNLSMYCIDFIRLASKILRNSESLIFGCLGFESEMNAFLRIMGSGRICLSFIFPLKVTLYGLLKYS